MCVAIPGRLVEVDGSRGKVEIRGNLLTVELGIVEAQVGDDVLVHAGCAISVVSGDQARELNELWDLVREDGQDA